ncbi:zinc finger protein DZIP1L isoform X6 [Octodon degus]|uniref:Zinc finger protein DZIP1L isoform X6 n=1 Tax=Octodon degus TaxID=10160 RepID=A0A6P6DQZ5_OCTDE|nr:zinc finger protein DZIP1L isoform X6 [Octodon degus]
MVLFQFLGQLPWPWWHPTPVVSSGLLSPMQSSATTAEGFSSPLYETYTLPTFKFQPRRESIDWRRINALDVDRVAQELDVATLQENIAGVTFCNLNQEVCSRCGQPVDPVLLKVLRLAQLIIEYLLHCQDCLSANVAQLEARLQASLGQQQRGQQELGRQADELKGVREESRRRRKMISTLQQLLLQTGAHNYHSCHLCDKTFMNATFLRGHMQRRHAGVADAGKQKQQQRPAEELLEELRAKLQWTQGELEAQREAERQRQLQKLQAMQSHRVTESNLGSLRDEESEEQLRQAQELRALREKLETQKTEWKRKLKELQEERMTERRELQENERLQASLSQDQRKAAAQAQRQINALHAQLREQARLIASQEEKIQTLSLRKAERIQELPKAVDTEEDSPEEELEDSPDEQQQVLAALRQNPPLLKQFRPILEDTLEEKLESMGIKRDAKGITVQTLRHLESVLKAQQEQKARKFSEFLSLRKKLIKEATSRVKERQNRDAVSQLDGQPPVKSQRSTALTREVRPKSSTLHVAVPSKLAEPFMPALQSHNSQGPGPTQVSVLTPRPRRHGLSSTPTPQGPGLSSTPPFSSEEDSEGNTVHHTSPQTPQVPSKMEPQQEGDWDWSDTESSEENAQPPVKSSGGLDSSGTLVQSIVKNLEKQLEAPAKKPTGGVSLFLRPNAGPERAAMPGRKPQLSEDESDLEISSLEDLSQDLDQREKPKPLSRSKLPDKIAASAWSSGRPRVPGW